MKKLFALLALVPLIAVGCEEKKSTSKSGGTVTKTDTATVVKTVTPITTVVQPKTTVVEVKTAPPVIKTVTPDKDKKDVPDLKLPPIPDPTKDPKDTPKKP